MGMDIKLYGHGQHGHGHTWTRTTHTGTYLDRTFAVWLSLYIAVFFEVGRPEVTSADSLT